jgi:hypothetical protein
VTPFRVSCPWRDTERKQVQNGTPSFPPSFLPLFSPSSLPSLPSLLSPFSLLHSTFSLLLFLSAPSPAHCPQDFGGKGANQAVTAARVGAHVVRKIKFILKSLPKFLKIRVILNFLPKFCFFTFQNKI